MYINTHIRKNVDDYFVNHVYFRYLNKEYLQSLCFGYPFTYLHTSVLSFQQTENHKEIKYPSYQFYILQMDPIPQSPISEFVWLVKKSNLIVRRAFSLGLISFNLKKDFRAVSIMLVQTALKFSEEVKIMPKEAIALRNFQIQSDSIFEMFCFFTSFVKYDEYWDPLLNEKKTSSSAKIRFLSNC